MSNNLFNEIEKNSIMLYFDINERIKKLEEIFETIEYTSPSPHLYIITIERFVRALLHLIIYKILHLVDKM